MIIRDPDGVQVIELGDDEIVGGYIARTYEEGQRTWRRVTTDSPFVHGDFEVTSALDGRTLTLQVTVLGPDWATITGRVSDLLDAVEVPGWQLTVGATTWVCRPADSNAPIPPRGANSEHRVVTLTFPVQQARGI